MSDTTQQAEYWVIEDRRGIPICVGLTQSGAWRTLGLIEGSGSLRVSYGSPELLAPVRCVRVRAVGDAQ